MNYKQFCKEDKLDGLALYAHSELRKPKEKLDGLSLHTFSEIRDKIKPTIDSQSVVENIISKPEDIIKYASEVEKENHVDRSKTAIVKSGKLGRRYNDFGEAYHKIHDDISPDHETFPDESFNDFLAFTIYSSKKDPRGSANLNGYLRNRATGKAFNDEGKPQGFLTKYTEDDEEIATGHTEQQVKDAIDSLSSYFTPEYTIKKEVDTFCGIPVLIGEKLDKIEEIGTTTYLHSFASTSTSYLKAREFSRYYNNFKAGKYYIIHFICEPGSGISVVHFSPSPENEILLRYGTKIQYLGKHKTIKGKSEDIVFIFKAFRVSEAKPLSKYGPYHHPEGL